MTDKSIAPEAEKEKFSHDAHAKNNTKKVANPNEAGNLDALPNRDILDAAKNYDVDEFSKLIHDKLKSKITDKIQEKRVEVSGNI